MKPAKMFFEYIAMEWDCFHCGQLNKLRFDHNPTLGPHNLVCTRCKKERQGHIEKSHRPDKKSRQRKLERRKDWYAKDWVKRNKPKKGKKK